jgi:hypothetical protein
MVFSFLSLWFAKNGGSTAFVELSSMRSANERMPVQQQALGSDVFCIKPVLLDVL